MTKDSLIEAFIELVSEIGAHQVTLQKTAKRAKVPFSTAHYYYGGDWNLIFKDAVDKVSRDAQAFTAQFLQKHSGDDSNPIELYVEATFQWIKEYQGDSRLWLFNYYFSSLDHQYVDDQKAVVENARKRVLNLLFEAKGRGFYPKMKVSPDLAQIVHTLVFGLGVMAMVQNVDTKRIGRLKQEAFAQVSRVLEGALG